jgi:hypothetical protein
MMKQGIISVLVLLLIVASGCSTAEKDDIVITGGKVFTAYSLMPHAEAVTVKSNRIIAVGNDKEMSRHIEAGITSIQIPGSADFGMYDTIMAPGMLREG